MTGFALAPRRRPRALARISFGFGVALNELPFVAFYLLLASTVLAIAHAIESFAAWVCSTRVRSRTQAHETARR